MTATRFQTLEVRRRGAVAWLRLGRPARLNALTERMFAELADALRAVGRDEGTRALVLTGKGRGFCSGSDVEALKARLGCGAAQQIARLDRLGREVVLALHGLPVPSIAAVNGATAGGGLSLALACDLRVASADAVIAFGYTAVGLVPDLGATFFLPRLIGLSRACRLLWTNARLTAADALAVGLVDEVVPARELAVRAAALAAQVAAAPRLAVRLGRVALRRGWEGSLAEALDGETMAQALCLRSEDHRRGVRAFLDRRVAGGRRRVGGAGAGARRTASRQDG